MSYAVYSHADASPTRRAYDLYDTGPAPASAAARYGGGAAVAGPELHQQPPRLQQPQYHRGYSAYEHDGSDAHYAHHPRTASSGSGSDPRYHQNVAPHGHGRTISNGINGVPSFRDHHQQQQQHAAGIGSPAPLGPDSDYYPTYAEPYLSPGGGRPHFRQTSSDSRLHLRQQTHPATLYASPGTPPLAMPVRTSSGLAGAPLAATTSSSAAEVHHSAPPAYAPSLKVLQWTPQRGEENTQVTIILDATAIRNARRSPFTGAPASFGPPGLSGHDPRAVGANRHFVVVFGQAPAATQFTRAQVIDGNGVGQSMSAGPNEEDAFVVLTTFVPPRARMGPPNERTMVVVQTVDVDSDACVESCIVGEWEPPQLYSTQPRSITPRVHTLKRAGDELYSPRAAGPGSYRSGSEAIHVPSQNDWLGRSPGLMNNRGSATPALASGAPSHSNGYGHHEPESSTGDYGAQAAAAAPVPGPTSRHRPQPQLVRTSQISGSKAGAGATYSRKVVLKMQGDLNLMAMGWSNEEWTARRRLVQFWPQQDANVLNLAFRPIAQHEYVPNTIVVSCIFRDEWNECFVTSVDTIYLLEALVGARFSVEEKNRIRRNLEGFKPMTVSKSKVDAEPFFKLIMGFPNPKPRNIEKDVKVFPWKILAQALKKVMSKYSANYPLGQDDPAYVHHEESPPKTPQTPTAPTTQSHVPSPHIIHTEASPRLGGDGSPRASPHVVAAATPGSPFLEPPGHAGGSHNAHIGGFRSAPQSPYGAHSFRQSALDDPSFSNSAAFEPSYGSQKGLLPLSGSLSLDTVGGRNYSSFARPSHQAHLFPAAEDYGILASYSQPQLYSAEPLYEHQDARSDNGLGPPTSQAHLRSVSEGLRPYSQTPQPRMPSPVELDSLDGVVDPNGASAPVAVGLDGRDESSDSLRSHSHSHSHSQPLSHSHSPGSLLDTSIQTQSASE